MSAKTMATNSELSEEEKLTLMRADVSQLFPAELNDIKFNFLQCNEIAPVDDDNHYHERLITTIQKFSALFLRQIPDRHVQASIRGAF